jgi:DNA-binding NtrC family response regulator
MTDKRRGGERRRSPRGGRRPGDLRGYTPLVMVIDDEPRRREISEAILAKLMFAVAPVESPEKAASVLQALQPELIIADDEDANKLRGLLHPDIGAEVIVLGEQTRVTDALIEEVRRCLRRRSELSANS